MIVKQLLIGPWEVFCYVLGCEKSKEALVIDPAGDVERIIAEAVKEGLTIKHIFNTHRHHDHTAGNSRLQELTGADLYIHEADSDEYPQAKKIFGEENRFTLGELQILILHTPGHSAGGICLYVDGQLFTGDTLFVGDSGRTDLPTGHRPTLGKSIKGLMDLPDETVVWPGHDYGPSKRSTIGWEKRHNVNAREYGFICE